MLASDHTRLINKFIGLCKDDPKWPHPLRDLGFKAQLVEYTISLRESGIIRPDVIAVSSRLLHAIVADCKAGHNIDRDQDARYESLRPRDLATHVTVREPKRLTHDACYVDDQSNHASLEHHTNLPFITFGARSVEGHGKFASSEINLKLSSPTPLDPAGEPTSYYPFSPTDKDAVVVVHVLRALTSCLTVRRTAIKLTDPELIDRLFLVLDPGEIIGSKHAKDMKARIREIISVLLDSNAKLKDRASKLEAHYGAATVRALHRACADIVEQHDGQARITDEI